MVARISLTSVSFKRRLASACMLAIACYATPGLAETTQEKLVASVTAEERAACRPDVFRLCASAIPSVDRIIACMKRERPKLSPACAAVVDARLGKSKIASKAASHPVKTSTLD